MTPQCLADHYNVSCYIQREILLCLLASNYTLEIVLTIRISPYYSRTDEQRHGFIIFDVYCLLTYKALSPLGDVCLILYEAHVRAADHQGQDPYDQDDQLGVACGQSGGQGVQDAHVPGM